MADNALKPRIRGLSFRVTTPAGAALFVARSGIRYFVTGHPINGRPRDNASWLHDATTDHRGGPRERLSRARWRRVARRWTLAGIPGSLLSLQGLSVPVEWIGEHFGDGTPPDWTQIPWDVLAGSYAVALPLTAGAVYYPKAKALYASRELRREVVYPATKVACQILGQRWTRRGAVAMLDLPADFGAGADEDADAQPEARLYLPPVPLDAGIKKRLIGNVGARLGMPDAQGEWQEYGGRAWLKLTGADVPPKKVELGTTVALEDGVASSLRDAIMSAPMERPVIGVTQGGRVERADFDNDSPHLAASGGTGTGKSTLFRCLMVQRLRRGSGLLVLDIKGISHTWIYRLGPSRALCFYKIEEIHDAAVALGEELYRRRDEAVAAAKAGHPFPDFRVLDVLVEEANSLVPMLQAYWTARRKEIQRDNKAALEDDPGADVTEPPVKSPAVNALGFGIQMGRELCIHMHYAGQRLSVAAFGGQGGDRRESFQTRMLGKWTMQTWRMLCPGVPYRICPSGPRGIWAVVQGERVSVVRVPFLSMDIAVDMVADSPDPGTPVLPTLSGAVHGVRTIPGEVVQADRLAGVRGRLVSLSEAADTVGLTLTALQVASKRADNFPAPAEIGGPGKPNRYDLAALVEWRERRDGVALQVGPGGGSPAS